MKKAAIIILGITFFISCKKKDNTTPDNTTNQPTTTGASTTGGGVMGNLQSGYTMLDMGNGLYSYDSSVVATFYNAPLINTQPTNIYAGVVSVNNKILQFDNAQTYYNDTTKNISMNQLSWNVAGNGIVAAFSHTHTPIYPKFVSSNISSLDTCLKSNGFTVTVNGVTNASFNSIVSIYQGGNSVYKLISGPNSSVVFTPSDLAAFTSNAPATIYVFLVHNNSLQIGSVSYQFAGTYSYFKFSYLK